MPSCLGIYIENNLIKYAKISKEHENIKIEAFGIKFFDDMEQTIKQIIAETFSFKTPISINLGEENYTYSEVFSLLNKNDIQKSVETEFDFFCNEKGKNKNALRYKHLAIKKMDNADKLTILYAYTEKSNIVSKLQAVDGSIISGIYPQAIAVSALRDFHTNNNSVIVNIEKNTTITTIVAGEIYRVDIIPEGMKTILDAIKEKENSYSKSYEICKNTTLYTLEGLELQNGIENDHMEDIIPILYNIIENTKEIMTKNAVTIHNIYITGMGAVINNIDLYFQENFNDKKCEILKPYFLENTNLKVNIKDYIEVNSAIALALNGINNNKEMNFKSEGVFGKISKMAKIEIGTSSKQIKKEKDEKQTKKKTNLNIDLKAALDKIEMSLIRTCTFLLIVIVIYAISSKTIIKQINDKKVEIDTTISDTKVKTEEVQKNTKLINTRVSDYEKLLSNIEKINNEKSKQAARKKAFPNLLVEIQAAIPKDVKLLYIKNTNENHIQIQIASKQYEQLGYLVAAIKTEGILQNVTSTSGTKKEDLIYVTIDGNLNF